MSDGFKWYFIGLSLGMVIGMPSSSDLQTTMDRDFRDAAAAGTVTPAQHCRMLVKLQDDLNKAYARRADDKASVPHYTMTIADCVAAQNKAPAAPRP
jgi:hypothetical protein